MCAGRSPVYSRFLVIIDPSHLVSFRYEPHIITHRKYRALSSCYAMDWNRDHLADLGSGFVLLISTVCVFVCGDYHHHRTHTWDIILHVSAVYTAKHTLTCTHYFSWTNVNFSSSNTRSKEERNEILRIWILPYLKADNVRILGHTIRIRRCNLWCFDNLWITSENKDLIAVKKILIEAIQTKRRKEGRNSVINP